MKHGAVCALCGLRGKLLPLVLAQYQRKHARPIREAWLAKGAKPGRTFVTEKFGVTLTIDHIKPKAEGGTLRKGNLRVLCSECNLRKGAQPAKRFDKTVELAPLPGQRGSLIASGRLRPAAGSVPTVARKKAGALKDRTGWSLEECLRCVLTMTAEEIQAKVRG
jgi:hypothetical protein